MKPSKLIRLIDNNVLDINLNKRLKMFRLHSLTHTLTYIDVS